MRSRFVFVVVLLVLFLAAAGTTAASPPPEPLSGGCSDSLAESSAVHGVNLSIARCEISIHVHENGSSRRHTRFVLRSGADALGTNDQRRRTIVRNAFTPSGTDGADVRSTVNGNTLVVTARGRNVAHQSAGVVLFDAFANPNLYTDADAVTVHAPRGYRTANRPTENVTTNATAVTWAGDEDGAVLENTYAVFAPAGAFAGGLRGQVAIALAIGPTLLVTALVVSFLPTALFGVTSALLAYNLGGSEATDERVSLAAILVAFVAFLVAVAGRGTFGLSPRTWLAFLVPAALFFALGYHGRADRRAWGVVAALTLLPFVGVLAIALVERNGPIFDHPNWVIIFAVGGVVALVTGLIAFLVAQYIAHDRRPTDGV